MLYKLLDCVHFNNSTEWIKEFFIKLIMLNFKLHWRYQITCDSYYDTPAMEGLLANPDAVLQPGSHLLKNDLKTTIAMTVIDGQRIIVKRYNIVSKRHALMRYLAQSRARVCWQAAHTLLQAGIGTPRPIAMIEKRLGMMRSTSYYIQEFVAGMSVDHYFEAEQKSASWLTVATRIAALVSKLQHHKISHGDLKVTNILIFNQQPLLIDLDDTRQHIWRSQAKRAIKKDLQRFMDYWQDNPPVKELFRQVLGLKR